MEVTNVAVGIQKDSDGWFIGYTPNLHGCRTQAKTLAELYKRLEEVIQLCLEEEKPSQESVFIEIKNIKVPVYA